MWTFLAVIGKALLALVILWFPFIWWQTFLRGEFRFVYNPVIAFAVKHWFKAMGWTCGARCYVDRPDRLDGFGPGGTEPPIRGTPEHDWWQHECDGHGHQFRVRPFMGPVYVFWGIAVGYWNNPLEVEARREELDP